MMRGGNRNVRRMMNKMGVEMNDIPNVQEVIIKTDKKKMIISKPAVSEMVSKDSTIFTVTADGYEEVELESRIFSDEDIQMVSQNAGVNKERAELALQETNGDLARAIMLLSSE